MLRSFLIYLSKADWAKQLITRWPFAWRAASRFIAGETIDQAIEVVKVLNAKGIFATLDYLGEQTKTIEDAKSSTRAIIDLIEWIEQAGVDANVSVKLTQIGLLLDEKICTENLYQILSYAKKYNNFVRIDMEDSSNTERTLRIYRKIHEEFGFNNTGVVIQAYLYRSKQDIEEIQKINGKVRLCKGAYKESGNIAFPKKSDVDKNFDHLVDILLDGVNQKGFPAIPTGGKIPPIPAIASHDPVRLKFAISKATQKNIPKNAVEFQMLYGIRRDLQEQILKDGYPVRIYVPYGTQWYPYYVRRLAERPANVWFFVSNFFRH